MQKKGTQRFNSAENEAHSQHSACHRGISTRQSSGEGLKKTHLREQWARPWPYTHPSESAAQATLKMMPRCVAPIPLQHTHGGAASWSAQDHPEVTIQAVKLDWGQKWRDVLLYQGEMNSEGRKSKKKHESDTGRTAAHFRLARSKLYFSQDYDQITEPGEIFRRVRLY